MKIFFTQYIKIATAFIVTVCLIRVYEYFFIAAHLFVNHPFLFELSGLLYDIWFCLIFAAVSFIPVFLLALINKKIGVAFYHVLNVVGIVLYISLLIVFSERNVPFDHEFFTRSTKDSWLTAKQMMTSGFKLYIPFILYILFYFIFYYAVLKKKVYNIVLTRVITVLMLLSVCFIKFANPLADWFSQTSGYYLTCNKFSYWVMDSYNYFLTKDKFNADKLTTKELEVAINFYQQNHPFQYTSKEYPLLHKDEEKDVLGNFFNLNPTTPPNIVLIVSEGLSRDFSGENAYATSFTPFLDSLSKHSLTWDNFLSTAPGTFAAHPSLTGSLPYGKKGFSIMNEMPEHLSLIKILRANGYTTNFMVGFNTDFDNMGGYIRAQGTDFILNQYPSKYKEMGIGSEGWSMGYPDDALFARSFEVMDSMPKQPYFNIYHTATTHMPYLFEQKPLYEKLFDEKIKKLNITPAIRRTLKETKTVLVTYMFSDDCMKKFFKDYAKRPEYKNTIFIITGDHHIGSFPITGQIDDYHVPLIIYSPMLKAPKKFLSVNSHLNIAPTFSSLILNNYKQLPYHPQEVSWLGGVMDTAAVFRNTQSMAFMQWGREINDYIYKDYFISDGQLYKILPDLFLQKIKNDSVKNFIEKLRTNFITINYYVCDNNKIFPASLATAMGNKKLLVDYTDAATKKYFTYSSDTILMKDYKVPKEYKYLYVEATAEVNLPAKEEDLHPTFRFALIDDEIKTRNYLYWSKRDIATLSKGDFVMRAWNNVSTNDMFTLDDYKKIKNLVFSVALYTDSVPINLQMRNLHVQIFGVK
ncbi:MAG: LTA synthase family protein [Bacteroidetes bacterium]|nr:LTA synthase family protein [Bacteroidota bacterium]